MSQILEVEDAWYDLLAAVAAKGATAKAGTVTDVNSLRSVSCSATGWTATADAYKWAVLTWTSGTQSGRFRVLNASSVAAGSLTLSWRNAMPETPAVGNTFSVSFAPLAGAKVFQRAQIPETLAPATELPAVFVAGQRRRVLTGHGVGNTEGSVRADLTIRTDLLSAWTSLPGQSGGTDDVAAHSLYEQVDQIRLCARSLGGIALIDLPTQPEDVAAFGELDRGQRVYWSTLWTPFHYNV